MIRLTESRAIELRTQIVNSNWSDDRKRLWLQLITKVVAVEDSVVRCRALLAEVKKRKRSNVMLALANGAALLTMIFFLS
jgi:hypothetical protein